jgi:CRISPR-associated endonuclease Cas1
VPGTASSPKTYLFSTLDPAAWQAAADQADPSVLICDGIQTAIKVRAGHLTVEDGPPDGPRTRRIARLPRSVTRLLILGDHGYITLEASRWLAETGVAFAHIDRAGTIVTVSGPRREDARLIRAQALAQSEPVGGEITRHLLTAKLHGQASNLDQIFRATGAATMIREYADELAKCESPEDMRSWEAQAAIVYWQVWADQVKAPFRPSDARKIPAHWLSFASRTSAVWDYPKNMAASDPANAMLNYIYRVAETEATHACHALGLHPALGVLHQDKVNRDSMALDILESVRPICDRIVLEMLDTGLGAGPLDRRNFTESYQGQCWLVPPLTHCLASHAALIGAQLRPHAEATARILAEGKVRIPTRKLAAVPASSTRRVRLREDVTLFDLMPDHVWEAVSGYIPLVSLSGKGRPRLTAADREVTAALAAHELLGVPWKAVPVSVSVSTCQARLREWGWTRVNGQSAWEHISAELQRDGYLSALVAAG